MWKKLSGVSNGCQRQHVQYIYSWPSNEIVRITYGASKRHQENFSCGKLENICETGQIIADGIQYREIRNAWL